MLKKDKSNQETVGCLVLEVMLVKPPISPQPAQTLYETRHKKLFQPSLLHLIRSSTLSLGSTHLHSFWKGDTSSEGSWDNRASEEDQSDQSKLAPISITLAEFNRIFLDCLKNPRPCLRNQPQKVPVWSPAGTTTCTKSTVLLWLLSPSPETVFTAKIFKNDYWFWMLKLKHLEKIILFFHLKVSMHFHSSSLV